MTAASPTRPTTTPTTVIAVRDRPSTSATPAVGTGLATLHRASPPLTCRPARRGRLAHPTGGPMPTSPSTRQQILDTALTLFTVQGYDATSLRQIADRLGVTKAALYYHF